VHGIFHKEREACHSGYNNINQHLSCDSVNAIRKSFFQKNTFPREHIICQDPANIEMKEIQQMFRKYIGKGIKSVEMENDKTAI